MNLIKDCLGKLSGFSGSVFLFGCLLVLLGVTKGIPGIDLIVDDNYRRVSVLVGLAFALMALLLRYHRNDDSKNLK